MTKSDLILVDDGTLDTVFHCTECEQDIRYSQEWGAHHRDENGVLQESAWGEANEEHDEECGLIVERARQAEATHHSLGSLEELSASLCSCPTCKKLDEEEE